jgi:hypothetical protein
MEYKKNKKALGINTEFMVAIVAIFFVVVVSIFAYNLSLDSKEQYKKVAPELSYQFPAVFVHSFLMMKVSDEDVKKLNLDEKQDYFVKDLLVLKRDDTKRVIEEMKGKYIEMYTINSNGESSPLADFESFSDSSFNPDRLLCIYYDKQEGFNLEANIVRNNYYFYIRTIEDDKAYVRFNC